MQKIRKALVPAVAAWVALAPAAGARLAAQTESPSEEAVSAADEQRIRHLFENIKCWCETENWSRTLAGCWEDCANRQREMIRAWVGEGLSDQEVLDRMVEEAGTTRVLGVPRSTTTVLLPYLLLLCAGGFVCAVLFKLLRTSRGDGAGSPQESQAVSRLDAELEEELRKLDD